MLSNCVYAYIFSWSTYNNRNCNDVFSGLVEKVQLESKTIVHKPIPLVNGKLAPVSWYYSLFNEDELLEALKTHNSLFPTKTFLVFKDMKPITLGDSEKALVEFQVVEKKTVDAFLIEYFDKVLKDKGIRPEFYE